MTIQKIMPERISSARPPRQPGLFPPSAASWIRARALFLPFWGVFPHKERRPRQKYHRGRPPRSFPRGFCRRSPATGPRRAVPRRPAGRRGRAGLREPSPAPSAGPETGSSSNCMAFSGRREQDRPRASGKGQKAGPRRRNGRTGKPRGFPGPRPGGLFLPAEAHALAGFLIFGFCGAALSRPMAAARPLRRAAPPRPGRSLPSGACG